MSVDDMKASADAVRDAVQAALNATHAAISEAHDLAQDAAAHGWEGVARTVIAAGSLLESVASDLSGAQDATEGATNVASQITNQSSSKDIAERAGAVIAQHDQAVSRLDSADSSAGQAYQYAQHAEADRLIGVVGALLDHIGIARQSVQAARATAANEQQIAGSWGN